MSVPDISKVISPDLKNPGESKLGFIDLGNGKNRLGGSALAQAFGQLGNETPDADGTSLKNAFDAIQEMINSDLLLSGHDRSDGGLITALVEMALAGNCGLRIAAEKEKDLLAFLFSEELGLVIEYLPQNEEAISSILRAHAVSLIHLGETAKERVLSIACGNGDGIELSVHTLRAWWEATSARLEEEQMDPVLAQMEYRNAVRIDSPEYRLKEGFVPKNTLIGTGTRPRIAIIREEGSNGDREMAAAFYTAGFEPWDVATTDLLGDNITLETFQGIAFVGGFSYMDVFDSAKGWAAAVRFNERVRTMFNQFYERRDTFSLGVCNGCQLMALLGWVPGIDLADTSQPRFIRNKSRKFESRWLSVRIEESPSILFRGMEGSVMGTWVAHGEGQLVFPDPHILERVKKEHLVPLAYADPSGEPTEEYPYNPNGSLEGRAALTSPCGRHTAMMPHPERSFLKWQWPWMPEAWKKNLEASPWLQMFQNARTWCLEAKR